MRKTILLTLMLCTGCTSFSASRTATKGADGSTSSEYRTSGAKLGPESADAAGGILSTVSDYLPGPLGTLVAAAGAVVTGLGAGLLHKKATDKAYDEARDRGAKA